MSDPETYHGTRQRVSWAVETTDDTQPHPATSTVLHGEDEESARTDFARRSKAMHRGKTMRLTRLVVTEAWVQHCDTVQASTKPALARPTDTEERGL